MIRACHAAANRSAPSVQLIAYTNPHTPQTVLSQLIANNKQFFSQKHQSFFSASIIYVQAKIRMVCTNEKYIVAVCWDHTRIYAIVMRPTEYQSRLVNAVNSLPPIYRKIIILLAFEQVTREDIAAILEISVNSVRFLINISGLLLRICLADRFRNHSENLTLNDVFPNWPWLEYAELAKLRRNMLFLK